MRRVRIIAVLCCLLSLTLSLMLRIDAANAAKSAPESVTEKALTTTTGKATEPQGAALDSSTEAIVLVAFGTTVPESKVALDAIHAAYAQRGQPVIWAYTSDIIRRKLEKQGKPMLSVNAAMNKAAAMGAKRLRIQSLHVGAAEEFHQLERMIVKNLLLQPGRFHNVLLGHPLLESEKDMDEVITALLAELPKARKADEAVVFMGHGNDRGPGDLMLYAVGKALQDRDSLAYLAAVEGSSTFEKVLTQLKAKGVKRVWLQPLMIVAGDHARNDMAGPEEDSWASQIIAAGMEPVPHLKGLGELKGVQAVFLRHTDTTTDDLANSKKSD